MKAPATAPFITTTTSAKKLRLRGLAAAAALALAVTGGVAAVPAAASSHAPLDTSLSQDELRSEVARTIREAGFIGMTVEVRDGRRRIHARAGEAELNTGRPLPYGAEFRAGSVTKTFLATVVLQLAAEGRLSLSDTVDTWLPGVVHGNGNDGRRVTIRNLLQHTSGIYNYDLTEDLGDTAADFERTRFYHVSPERYVATTMRHKPDFPPADPDDPEPDWNYSNPNYLLAGMIIKKVTGKSWAEEVRDRIIRPVGLKDTYAPGDDPYLKQPYAHTYHRFPGSAQWTDTTVRNVSWADAAGSLVSTERDLDRFFAALLGGRLLPAAQLAEMRKTVPVNADFEMGFPGMRYGLGLVRQPLSCGGYRWGHGGDLEGGTVVTGFSPDGRRSVVVSASGTSSDDEESLRSVKAVQGLLDRVMCGEVRR
ncbi:serine hydrolase domain-containing protein [Streptomyces sp. ME19-01-6]|uniref:serine hydrolase domain-containing protein n=1 Tax=Streptomyces sp. ME19-01-6 TaxID=3028686 RepID=UPI0029A74FDB|nr:serine hydrolase domain-containing protein [Streptomyces sp. ME19-01-6]MDX3228743.1 serine hydrolase [Streptomyces sp. ME19-01-6]